MQKQVLDKINENEVIRFDEQDFSENFWIRCSQICKPEMGLINGGDERDWMYIMYNYRLQLLKANQEKKVREQEVSGLGLK